MKPPNLFSLHFAAAAAAVPDLCTFLLGESTPFAPSFWGRGRPGSAHGLTHFPSPPPGVVHPFLKEAATTPGEGGSWIT